MIKKKTNPGALTSQPSDSQTGFRHFLLQLTPSELQVYFLLWKTHLKCALSCWKICFLIRGRTTQCVLKKKKQNPKIKGGFRGKQQKYHFWVTNTHIVPRYQRNAYALGVSVTTNTPSLRTESGLVTWLSDTTYHVKNVGWLTSNSRNSSSEVSN